MLLDTSIEDDVREYFMLHKHEDFTKTWKYIVANNVVIPTTRIHIVGIPIPNLELLKAQSKSPSNIVPNSTIPYHILVHHIIEDDNENNSLENEYEVTWLGDGSKGGFISNDNYYNI